jgi:hypothetical protein
MTVIIKQAPAPSLTDVATQLHDAFVASRDAIESAEAVVFIAKAPDLIGQGSVEDAAVAGGLLGLMRALMFEGGTKGWHVNLIAIDRGAEADPELLAAAGAVASINGQVLNASVASIGKVIP